MANFALVVGNIAVNVSSNPAAEFQASLAAEFTSVPDDVRQGWLLSGGTWAAPPAPTPPAPAQQYLTTVNRAQFKFLFTAAEYAALTTSTDAEVQFFIACISDASNPEITVTHPKVSAALDYCASIGDLTAPRVAEIKLGWPL